MDKVYCLKIEIRPLTGSQLFMEHPHAKGAFVDVIAAAQNEIEAKEKAKNALFEDHYEIVAIEEVIDFAQIEMVDADVARDYKAMAWDALMDGIISYGTFYGWPDKAK